MPSLDRAETLIAELARNADAEQAAILAAADADCAAIEKAARHNATTAAAAAIADLRRAAARRIARAEAELATARRYRLNRSESRAVERVRPLLAEALARRWADPAGAAAWVRTLVAAAERHLPRGSWVIEHPPGFDPDAHADIFKTLEKAHERPAFIVSDDLAAGLRIRVGSAILDGSAGKLLADGALVGGLVIAALQSPAKAGGSNDRDA
ncbi:MAG: hypothetical protein R3D02_01360 [Hyphomicrobiales bacterium]